MDDGSSRSGHRTSSARRLVRSKALKNVDYDAVAADAETPLPSPYFHPHPPDADLPNLRMHGFDGEFDLICRRLGFSDPEDFGIPSAVWEEARKTRSSSDNFLFTPSRDSFSRSPPTVLTDRRASLFEEPVNSDPPPTDARRGGEGVKRAVELSDITLPNRMAGLSLSPPPPISVPRVDDRSSTWDIVRSFAPDHDEERPTQERIRSESEEDQLSDDGVNEDGKDTGRGTSDVESSHDGESLSVRLGETDNELTESTRENPHDPSAESPDSPSASEAIAISANAMLRRSMVSWTRGEHLGSGSFGTVFEAISE